MSSFNHLPEKHRPLILVCGGAGYIGSHVARSLLETHDFDVVIVDNLAKGHIEAISTLPVAFERGDIRDASFMDHVFDTYPIEGCMHFCADIEAGESMVDPMKFYHNNVFGGIVLAQAMVKHNVKRLIFSSSAAIFGNPVEPNTAIAEAAPKAPINAYGQTKLALEEMFHWCDVSHGLKTISLRYFNAAGAHVDGTIGEAHEPESHLIPIVLQVASGKRTTFKLFGNDYPTRDGTCIRDYIHVSDLATAHVAALRYLMRPVYPGDAPVTSDCFNLGSGTGFSVLEVVEAARRVTGHPIPTEVVARRPGDPAFLVADCSKARRVLGWTPIHNLDSIVETAWRWQSSPNFSKWVAGHATHDATATKN